MHTLPSLFLRNFTEFSFLFPAAYKIFRSVDGVVDWSFIVNLYKFQESIGLRFGNKLSKKHVEFFQNKMKVKLAVQALSSSVADAIDWLRAMGVPEFQGSQATTRFIRTLDEIFDFLNSRNPFAKGYKKPIFANNIQYFEKKVEAWCHYLNSLTTLNNIPLVLTRRKCFVIGFVATLKAVLQTSKILLATDYYRYVLTYKFSQDHLEFLFGIFRLRLGCNNNPTALQLKYILKKVLLKNSISISAATNCTIFNDDSEVGNLFEIRRPSRRQLETEDTDSENLALSYLPELDSNSFFKDSILYYILGYIVFKLSPFVSCNKCCLALISSEEHFYSKGVHSFTTFKNRGGLHVPSMSVFRIIKESENCIQYLCKGKTLKNLRTNIVLYNVKKHLLFDADNTIFPDLDCDDSDFHDNHKIRLVNLICKRFLKIRFYSFEQAFTDRVSQRNKNLKTTLFRNE